MITYDVEYNKHDPRDIERYARLLIGKSFRDICKEDEKTSLQKYSDDYAEKHQDIKFKGGLGNLIEERYFHYDCNSDSEPDFKEAGVELKVTPYKIGKKKEKTAKERLSLTMIDYNQLIDEEFENSHLWHKCRLMLIIYYLYRHEIEERLDYKIDYVSLFTPPEEDLKIIKHDFELIRDKVRAGKAHELSEGDTLYLGAATKSSDSKKTRVQPNSDIPAKPRAFSFKPSYMTYVLNNYLTKGVNTCERILPSNSEMDFEGYVTSKISKYCDWTVKDLCFEYQVDQSKSAKHLGAILAYRILGIKGNKAEEFVKANIVIKTIRIENSNSIKEHMSFPTFKFKELIKEEWEDSTFGNYLKDTRFLFIVYKFDENNELHLKGCQFWNMPYDDIENEVHRVWERTKKVLTDGLQVTYKNGKMYNNLPKQSENAVCHVRPHATDAKDTYELPDGREYPKQCFWLNRTYIYDQLDDKFKI